MWKICQTNTWNKQGKGQSSFTAIAWTWPHLVSNWQAKAIKWQAHSYYTHISIISRRGTPRENLKNILKTYYCLWIYLNLHRYKCLVGLVFVLLSVVYTSPCSSGCSLENAVVQRIWSSLVICGSPRVACTPYKL